jgi:hypothetical protein
MLRRFEGQVLRDKRRDGKVTQLGNVSCLSSYVKAPQINVKSITEIAFILSVDIFHEI